MNQTGTDARILDTLFGVSEALTQPETVSAVLIPDTLAGAVSGLLVESSPESERPPVYVVPLTGRNEYRAFTLTLIEPEGDT